jgi:hypothetical protein
MRLLQESMRYFRLEKRHFKSDDPLCNIVFGQFPCNKFTDADICEMKYHIQLTSHFVQNYKISFTTPADCNEDWMPKQIRARPAGTHENRRWKGKRLVRFWALPVRRTDDLTRCRLAAGAQKTAGDCLKKCGALLRLVREEKSWKRWNC